MTRSVGGSTLWMTSEAVDGLPRIAAPPGALNARPTVRSGSTTWSSRTGTLKVREFTPGPKVSVCAVGGKFTFGAAEPRLVVETVTDTGTCESTVRVTCTCAMPAYSSKAKLAAANWIRAGTGGGSTLWMTSEAVEGAPRNTFP